MSSISKELNKLKAMTMIKKPNQKSLSEKSFEPLYQSGNVQVNQSYILFTSSGKRPPSFDLLYSKNINHFSSNWKLRIKRKIDEISKDTLGVSGAKNKKSKKYNPIENETFKNRPIINLDRNALDFSVGNTVTISPTNRGGLTSGFMGQLRNRNGSSLRSGHSYSMNWTMPNIPNFKRRSERDREDHERFMRELSAWKQRKIVEWGSV